MNFDFVQNEREKSFNGISAFWRSLLRKLMSIQNDLMEIVNTYSIFIHEFSFYFVFIRKSIELLSNGFVYSFV